MVRSGLLFGRPWHDLLCILLHSDRQVFVDQASCHTLSNKESFILLFKAGVLNIQLHIQLPSAVFITFTQLVPCH